MSHTKVVIYRDNEETWITTGEIPDTIPIREEYLMENTPHPPKFCPECGTPEIMGVDGEEGIDYSQCCEYETTTSLYYDCYCHKCGWQGNIYPFEDYKFYQRQGLDPRTGRKE